MTIYGSLALMSNAQEKPQDRTGHYETTSVGHGLLIASSDNNKALSPSWTHSTNGWNNLDTLVATSCNKGYFKNDAKCTFLVEPDVIVYKSLTKKPCRPDSVSSILMMIGDEAGTKGAGPQQYEMQPNMSFEAQEQNFRLQEASKSWLCALSLISTAILYFVVVCMVSPHLLCNKLSIGPNTCCAQ